jgi:hypothetical protein
MSMINISNIDDITNIIKKARDHNELKLKIHFATIEKQVMFLQLDIPQLYHDQLNIIGEYLWDIKNNPDWKTSIHEQLVAND